MSSPAPHPQSPAPEEPLSPASVLIRDFDRSSADLSSSEETLDGRDDTLLHIVKQNRMNMGLQLACLKQLHQVAKHLNTVGGELRTSNVLKVAKADPLSWLELGKKETLHQDMKDQLRLKLYVTATEAESMLVEWNQSKEPPMFDAANTVKTQALKAHANHVVGFATAARELLNQRTKSKIMDLYSIPKECKVSLKDLSEQQMGNFSTHPKVVAAKAALLPANATIVSVGNSDAFKALCKACHHGPAEKPVSLNAHERSFVYAATCCYFACKTVNKAGMEPLMAAYSVRNVRHQGDRAVPGLLAGANAAVFAFLF